jgi:hypothetical protein
VTATAENWSRVNSFWGVCLSKNPWPQRLLWFALASFHSLGCGKFPISVWLEAQGTRMQFTNILRALPYNRVCSLRNNSI